MIQAGADIIPRLLQPLAEGPFAGLLLGRRPADPPSFIPGRILPGNPDAGRALVQGELVFAGSAIIGGDPWAQEGLAAPGWRRIAHGFQWLDDLAALGGTEAENAAARLISGWLDRFSKPCRPIWKGGATGERVIAILAHWDGLLRPADPLLKSRLLDLLARQIAHLARIGAPCEGGTDRLHALIGLSMGALALPSERRWLDGAVVALGRELDRQILPDGGHVSRAPRVQLSVLARLVVLGRCFEEARIETPESVIRSIDRMAPMLRFFRHGDGGLALFNGAREGDNAVLDLVLAQADARGRPPARAPHCGFERLQAGKTLILCDAGGPPSEEFGAEAHAGTLSFEMSIGKERLVVNCGRRPSTDPGWLVAQKSTAAHSVLCVEDTNSSAISNDGLGFDARRAVATAERNESDGAVWLDMGHDGYWKPFGLLYRRRIYLAPDGLDLRGEDQLDGPADRSFAVRFHLHPKVSVSLLGSKTSALLKLPQGGGWRFRATGAEIALEDSLYFGTGGEPKRMQQIVLRGRTTGSSTTIKWAFQKEVT